MATTKPAAVKGGKPTKAVAAASAPASSSVKGEADLVTMHPVRTYSASETRDQLLALTTAKRGYIVQDSLHLDGKAYQAGDPITLTADQVEGLPAGIVLAAEE
ncbi:MAG: hypothetical protein RSE32_08100 [Comamonas sp.]|uniref:hypothetical protein n=1 Tax=Comamonas sp. TaxID=34028 RepID=UPI002FCB986B